MKSEKKFSLEDALRSGAARYKPVPSADFEQKLTAALAAARVESAGAVGKSANNATSWHRRLAAIACAGVLGGIVFFGLSADESAKPTRVVVAINPQVSAPAVPASLDVSALAKDLAQQLKFTRSITPAQQEVLSAMPHVIPSAALGGALMALPLGTLFVTSPDSAAAEPIILPESGMI